MSVFPDNSKPVPEGTQTIGSLGELEKVTEESVKTLIKARHLPASQNVAGAFTAIVSGIGQALRDGIKGVVNSLSSLFRPVYDAGQEMRDGQMALTERQDLIDKVLNYGSCFPSTMASAPASTWVRAPFNTQIGAARGVTQLGYGLRLDSAGTWDCRAQIVTTSATGLLPRTIEWQVRVYRPNRTLHTLQVGRIPSKDSWQQSVVMSFQVDEPGCTVEVWLKSINYYGKIIGTGPKFCRLTAQQVDTVDRGAADGSEASELGEDTEEGAVND